MSSNPGSGGTCRDQAQCNYNSSNDVAATHHVVEGQGVVLHTLMAHTSPDCLPHHQAEAVDVDPPEVLEDRHVHGHVQDLGRHVSLGADPGVLGDVGLSRGLGVGDGKGEVSDDAAAVFPHQDVLRLDVPVGDGWLALGPEYLGVKVDHPGDGGDQHLHGVGLGESGPVEMVVERAQGVIVSHQPQLGAGVTGGAV